jgi:amidohydrolase
MAYMMEAVPGCYFFVGSKNESRDLKYPHHNPRFDIDEEAMVIGASLLAQAAASYVIPE